MTDIKKIILATLTYNIVAMALGYPWYILWFHDIYASMFTRQNPILILGIIATLIESIVIAYLYPFYYRGGRPVIEGIKFSLIVGLLPYAAVAFSNPARMDINPVGAYIAATTGYNLILCIVSGALLGLIYGSRTVTESRVPAE
jgi:quinol-cytochrome oxidoreductase complex cytochrome b subunit